MRATFCLIQLVCSWVMNKVLQVEEMISLLEQRAIIVKWCYETHLLKHFHNDFILKFPNAVFLSTRTVWNMICKIWKRTYAQWFTILGTTVYGDIRKEGDDCKACHRAPHHIITMTGTAGRSFTHVDIRFTLFHSLPIQNFDSTRVKAKWFVNKRRVVLMSSSLSGWWCFDIRYILLQRWSLVPFKSLHKYLKVTFLCLENPHIFWTCRCILKNGRLVCHESQTCSRTTCFQDNITAEVYCNIIEQFIALLHEDK